MLVIYSGIVALLFINATLFLSVLPALFSAARTDSVLFGVLLIVLVIPVNVVGVQSLIKQIKGKLKNETV